MSASKSFSFAVIKGIRKIKTLLEALMLQSIYSSEELELYRNNK